MDTFELLPTLAQGDLSGTSTPELVAAVFRSRASGTLWLETPNSPEIRIFFRAGDMCGASEFPGVQTLAHVLLANDWVNALDIESSQEEAARTRKRHGEVLVARRLLTAEQLKAALAAQHRTNLLNLLRLTQGHYDWRGWEPPPSWAREVVVDPVGCVVDALEEEQHAARRAKVIEWLGDNAARLSVDWPDLQARVMLAPVDRRAAALLALPRTVAGFIDASQLPPMRAEALLATLLLAGAAEPEVRDPVLDGEPVTSPEVITSPEAITSPENVVDREEPDGAALDEREQLARLDALTLDEPLPRFQGAPAVEDEELELDLDRAASKSPPRASPSPPSAGADEERARELRKKMLVRGIRNLGAPPQRPELEGAVLETVQSRAAADGELSDENQRFVDEVRSRLRIASNQNAYGRLGVEAAASTDAIRGSYLKLAKQYHPDRAAGPLGFLQPELEKLFSLLKEAYEQIESPAARAKYDAALKARSPAAVRKEEAETALRMGEVLLKKRDFDGALEKLRRAVDLEPTGDAMAALAWGLVSDPKSTGPSREEATTLINRALRAPGATARTFYVAGVLWRTKDPESAVDAFRKALELDPKHADAALELRLIEQRRGKQAKGGGVLSGLLFGKRKS